MIFLDRTKCAICGNVLATGDEVTGLPAFATKDSPLYPFSDAGFHTSCYEKWDKREEVEQIIAQKHKEFIESDFFKDMLAKYGRPKWLDE